MEFSREHPVVSLMDPGKTDTFIADVFQPRPDFEEVAHFHALGSEAAKNMTESMTRKNCPVA